ncbi:armadillo repeat-containing protein 6 homolog [Macrosteles quadrilineatus]|uniref:armadillo repeat-containing protein 6 homolog n=1 Tax=Macrosteles quadrilineatus TaxID=74068 RepID=UPI0023E14C3C|nr:armadillo repeat-containing protein 6 homolog [Macrosteles quadrilineatus]
MVRVINQQTFDDVVKENMEEFGMSVEEAIEEAVQQFEAQGVNLSGIIKTVEMAEGKDPLIICLNQLKEVLRLKSATAAGLTNLLMQLRDDCAKDLARRVLAGKQGAYPVLLDALDKFSNDTPTMVLCLQALTSLMTGFPDLLDDRGAMTIKSLLNTNQSSEVLQNTLKWSRTCCVNHETNRQMIVDKGVIPPVKALVEKNDKSLIPDLCGLVRALTLDDDVRAEVSKAHSHASALAIDLLCPFTNLLAQHKEDKKLVLELVMTMNCLVVRNEFCAKVEENGGIQFVIDVLTCYSPDERIVRNTLLLLKALSGNDDVKLKVMQSGAHALVMLALHQHQKSVPVCLAGLGCLCILTLRSQDNSKVFVEQGAPDAVIQIMKIHPKELKVQRNCCWAIRNIVARSPDLRKPFLKLGAEELINAARRQHKELDYDAKSALRDLGCKVDFNEQWKGKGVQMIR